MKWLIAEDSLQGRAGHWFNYLKGFHDELPTLGDQVTLLVSRRAESFICTQLGAKPVLPEGVFLKMSDGSPWWRRYARIPAHAYRTYRAMGVYWETAPPPDLVFVPTVTIHHLLAWGLLARSRSWPRNTRLLLFFPGLPIIQGARGVTLDGSPTSKLMRWLFRRLRPNISTGRVVLGVETEAMQAAAQRIFGTPFTYLPHPAAAPAGLRAPTPAGPLVLGAYGPARHEKGSDVLVAAIDRHLIHSAEKRLHFVVQWTDDFAAPSGELQCIPERLRAHPRVEIIDRLFLDGEYERRLAGTDALLLPYRTSTYALRVSRMMVEAVVRGLPVVTVRGTTLHGQMERFGAGVECADGDVASLATAIGETERRFAELQTVAQFRTAEAREHFSVRAFRSRLLQR